MDQMHDNTIAQSPLKELRQEWAKYWGVQPHAHIGRLLLEKSILYKRREQSGLGITAEQRARIDQLVRIYKRNPKNVMETANSIKPGTKLIKTINGERHVVKVLPDGFEYRNQKFSSLSVIASNITGTQWNGWVFFGLKKRGSK